MPTLRITITAEVDGQSVDGFPFTHQVQGDVAQEFDFVTNPDPAFFPLPDSVVMTLQALLVRTDKPLAIRLNDAAVDTVTLNPGGLLLLLDCKQPGDRLGPVNTYQQNSGNAGTLKGVAIGA